MGRKRKKKTLKIRPTVQAWGGDEVIRATRKRWGDANRLKLFRLFRLEVGP